MGNIGFDNEQYLRTQSEKIRERVQLFGGKLYMEFGGKLFDDYHASRVLPGFLPDSKVKMLLQMKDQAEIVIVISAGDIEKNKVRGDLGITYDVDVLRLIDAFRGIGLYVGSVVLTQYNAQPAAEAFQKRLESLGVKVFPALHHSGLPLQHPPYRQRRGLWQKRVCGDLPQPGGGHRPGPGQRQNGHLPLPAGPTSTSGG